MGRRLSIGIMEFFLLPAFSRAKRLAIAKKKPATMAGVSTIGGLDNAGGFDLAFFVSTPTG